MYCLRLFLTTLFTTMFTVIIVVCLLKSVISFVLSGCCVSELQGRLCPYVMYGVRLFTVVLQELHCLPYLYDQS